MSLGFIVVLDHEVTGLDPTQIDGRILAAHRHSLDAAAHEFDLPGLGEFVAFSQAEAETLAEDMKFDAPNQVSQTGRWFSCTNGLEVVRAIKSYLEDTPDAIDQVEPVIKGLNELEHVLQTADNAGAKFRLSIDY